MIKEDRYYPCDKCKIKEKIGSSKCPFEEKQTCFTYRACDNLTEVYLINNNPTSQLVNIPIEVALDILRAHGYTGELRKTEVVVI